VRNSHFGRAFASGVAPKGRTDSCNAPARRYRARLIVCLLIVCACIGFLVDVDPAFANSVNGAWHSPGPDNWPLIPIHASLMPDGRVLTFGTDEVGRQTGYFTYDIWDPGDGLGGEHTTLPNYTQTDIFCSFQLLLPNSGRIIMLGGDTWDGAATTNVGNNRSTLFDYQDKSLTSGNDMVRQRWYASATLLMNGEVYIQGGNAVGTTNSGNSYSEIRDRNGSFRRLDNVRPGPNNLNYYYPRTFVAPDGRIFGFDSNGSLFYVTTEGAGSLTIVGSIDKTLVGRWSTAAMFQPGRILLVSGNSNKATVIDINGPVPTVTPTGELSARRAWSNATLLPNGRVLVTGGSGEPNKLVNVVNHVEIWDPATGQWAIGAPGVRARLYHSVGLLLPDGSVLVGGGGASVDAPVNNQHSEIYYPPYLFAASGADAVRPVIGSAPEILAPGLDFSVSIASGDVARLTLLRMGAVTHSVNLAQNFVELPFTSDANVLFAEMPDRATDVPPGYYLLFALDQAGTPSVARIVRIDVPGSGGGQDTTAPTKPSNLSVTLSNGNPKLTWSASSDAIGVAGYSISRSTDGTVGVEVGLTSNLTWTDTACVEGTTYTYSVRAYDGAGNLSAHSTLKSILAFQKPTKPGNFSIVLSNKKPKLTFNASSDNVGVVGYNVYRSINGSMGSLYAQIAGSPWVDTAALNGVKYTYAVRARDAAGYLSSATALKSITSK
jgi:hypothetical protein